MVLRLEGVYKVRFIIFAWPTGKFRLNARPYYVT